MVKQFTSLLYLLLSIHLSLPACAVNTLDILLQNPLVSDITDYAKNTHQNLFEKDTASENTRFGEKFCDQPGFTCQKIKSGDSWQKLFPNKEARDLVKRVNRMNTKLRPGMILSIPANLERLTIYDLAPFPRYIRADGEKIIYVDQAQLAWGAYNAEGELVWWGPISPGIKSCPNVLGGCLTPEGVFRIVRKKDASCVSTAFPKRANGIHGGAEMPFCMHFFHGYALHGSHDVPGYPASHGCIRLFLEDAEWLNEEFIDIPGGGMPGTRVIIRADSS